MAALAFRLIDPGLRLDVLIPDSAAFSPSDTLARIEGHAAAILSAERALNFAADCRSSPP